MSLSKFPLLLLLGHIIFPLPSHPTTLATLCSKLIINVYRFPGLFGFSFLKASVRSKTLVLLLEFLEVKIPLVELSFVRVIMPGNELHEKRPMFLSRWQKMWA